MDFLSEGTENDWHLTLSLDVLWTVSEILAFDVDALEEVLAHQQISSQFPLPDFPAMIANSRVIKKKSLYFYWANLSFNFLM